MAKDKKFEDFVRKGGFKLPSFCIFCGKKPEEKNYEHVIPLWLLRQTGDPKRIANFGYRWLDLQDIGHREFSFDNFKFPACASCNTRHAELEHEVKPILLAIESEKPVSGRKISILLDWLDKVRTGLWLGLLLLNKNHAGVKPNFYIAQRISKKDRLVGIYKINSNEKGVGFGCFDTPVSVYSPSVFTLRVNDLYLLNASTDSLVSKSLGLPYISKTEFAEDKGMIYGSLKSGNSKLSSSFMVKDMPASGVFFGQSIRTTFYAKSDSQNKNERLPDLYSSEYCKRMYRHGHGRQTDIYIQSSGNLRPISWATPFRWSNHLPKKLTSETDIMRIKTSALKIQKNIFTSFRPKLKVPIDESIYMSDEVFDLIISAQGALISRASTKRGD